MASLHYNKLQENSDQNELMIIIMIISFYTVAHIRTKDVDWVKI